MDLAKYCEVLQIKDLNNKTEEESRRWDKLMSMTPTSRGIVCRAYEQGLDILDCLSKEGLYQRYKSHFDIQAVTEILKIKPVEVTVKNKVIWYFTEKDVKQIDDLMSKPRKDVVKLITEHNSLKKYGTSNYKESENYKTHMSQSIKNKWAEEGYKEHISKAVKKTFDNKTVEEKKIRRQHIKEASVRGKLIQKENIEVYRKELEQELGTSVLNITEACSFLGIGWDGLRRNRDRIDFIPEVFQKGNYKFFRKDDITKVYDILKSFSNRSVSENEFSDFIKSIYAGPIKLNDRTLLNGKELDVYLPDKKLAFEFNGLYWHSDIALGKPNEVPDKETRTITKYRHIQKTNLCKEKGIDLIHIFEDDWMFKGKVVESIIKARLGIFDRKVYARNCELREVSLDAYREFLENNHLQGYSYANYRLGLYEKKTNELLELIGINSTKNSHTKGEPEMVRLCTKLNTQVLGGFSKLLKHCGFKKLISYIDIGTFSGTGYLSNNFKIQKQNEPSYFYVKGFSKKPRYYYIRSNIEKRYKEGHLKYWNPQETEEVNMYKNGFGRVWNCGTYRVVWNAED